MAATQKISDIGVVTTFAVKNDTELTQWSNNYETSLIQAKKAGVPVFVDFTGYTCTNCRAMEANVFPLPPVQKRFNKMELVRLYTDGGKNGYENRRLQFNLTGTVALPTYIILDPSTENIIARQMGYTEKEAFLKFIDKGLSKFKKLNI